MAYIDKVSVGGSTYDVQDYRGDQLALTDGYYQAMTVGDAEQLVSTVGVEDKVPYLYRTSGGSADIGDREVDKLVGGTVAFNQLIEHGNFDATTGWNVNNSTISVSGNKATLTVTSTPANNFWRSLTETLNHKYLVSIFAQPSKATKGWIAFNGVEIPKVDLLANTRTQVSGIINVGSSHVLSRILFYFNPSPALPLSENDTCIVDSFICVDLTQMFGSTIADYIYTLETSTPGSGVAWFKNLFPAPYYAYNSGELMSVKTTAHNMTGLNQWDEQWESGGYDVTTGGPAPVGTLIRNKNKIKIVPNATYYFYVGEEFTGYNPRVFYYDANENYIGTVLASTKLFTVPENAYYINFHQTGTSVTKGSLGINLHWDGERDGDYEEYKVYSYPLDDVELRGIPKLDANNALYYDGDTYESDGTVTRKYGIVDLGTLEWSIWPNYTTLFRASLPTNCKTVSNETVANWITGKYVTDNGSDVPGGDKVVGMLHEGYIAIMDSAYTSKDAFTTAMNGVYLVYELATPTTESADSFASPMWVSDWGTEEYVDNRTIPICVGHETTYRPNLRAKLEMAPNSPSGDGDYLVRQSSGINTYVPITFPADELPAAPTTDGTYTLKCTVSDGTATFTWES